MGEGAFGRGIHHHVRVSRQGGEQSPVAFRFGLGRV